MATITAHATSACAFLKQLSVKSKYVNPWIILVEKELAGGLEELSADLMNKTILVEEGESYEVTRIGQFTGVVDSQTADRCFLMSNDTPFQRVFKSQSPERMLRDVPEGRALFLCQIERIPWVFDPVQWRAPVGSNV